MPQSLTTLAKSLGEEIRLYVRCLEQGRQLRPCIEAGADMVQ
jgi:hypothetical protein